MIFMKSAAISTLIIGSDKFDKNDLKKLSFLCLAISFEPYFSLDFKASFELSPFFISVIIVSFRFFTFYSFNKRNMQKEKPTGVACRFCFYK
jgi:hypothetical protein